MLTSRQLHLALFLNIFFHCYDAFHGFGHLKQRRSFYPDSTLSGEYFVFEEKEISKQESNETFLVEYACECRAFCSGNIECFFASIIYHANSSIECRITYYNPVLVALCGNENSVTVYKRKNKFFPAKDGLFYKFNKEAKSYMSAKLYCNAWSPKANSRLAVAKSELEANVLVEIVETYNVHGLTMVDLTTVNGTYHWGDKSEFDDGGNILINILSLPSPPINPYKQGVFSLMQSSVGYWSKMFEYHRRDFTEKMPFICQANPTGI